MTWATVITLLLVSIFSARRMMGPFKHRDLPEDTIRLIAFIRMVWFFALAYAMWERYL